MGPDTGLLGPLPVGFEKVTDEGENRVGGRVGSCMAGLPDKVSLNGSGGLGGRGSLRGVGLGGRGIIVRVRVIRLNSIRYP